MRTAMHRSKLLIVLLIAGLILVACGGAQPTEAPAEPTEAPTEAPEPTEEPEQEAEPTEEPAPTEEPEAEPTEEPTEETEAAGDEQVMIGAFDLGPGGCPQCFNPHQATAGFTWLKEYYSVLLDYDVNFSELHGVLADSWEISDDGLTYTFNLRDDVTWHDGEQFTAEDVAFTLQLVLTPDYASRLSSQFQIIEGGTEYADGEADSVSGINVVDDYTLEITLSEPNAPFLNSLAELIIVPEHELSDIPPADLIENDWWRTNPIGTGPFQWDTWTPDESVELVAYDDYFEGRPELDRLINRYFTEQSTAVLALEEGEIDFTYITNDEVERLREQESINVIEGPSQVVNFLAPNLQGETPFDDVSVRQAIMYAIDRQAIVESIFGGGAEVANCTWTNPAYVPDDLNQYEYDPDQARQLLADAGYADGIQGEFEVLTYYTDQTSADILVAVQQYLSDVGINMTIRNIDVPTFIDEYYENASFQLAYVGAQNGPDPHTNRQQLHSEAGYPEGFNASEYSNEEVDRLFDEGARETDPEARAEIYAELCQVLNEDVPWIFLWETTRYGAVRDRVNNFIWTPAPGGRWYDDQSHLWSVSE